MHNEKCIKIVIMQFSGLLPCPTCRHFEEEKKLYTPDFNFQASFKVISRNFGAGTNNLLIGKGILTVWPFESFRINMNNPY